jgi:hypothetical protein
MTGWLRCRLTNGMFSDELAVFVPRAYVRNVQDQLGQVQVDVFVQGGTQYAVMPNARRDIVRVEEADHLDQR